MVFVVEDVGGGVVVVSAVETVVVSVVVEAVVSVVVVVASVEVEVNADETSTATSRNDATPARPHIVAIMGRKPLPDPRDRSTNGGRRTRFGLAPPRLPAGAHGFAPPYGARARAPLGDIVFAGRPAARRGGGEGRSDLPPFARWSAVQAAVLDAVGGAARRRQQELGAGACLTGEGAGARQRVAADERRSGRTVTERCGRERLLERAGR
jgi:hypothetical protein